MRNLIFGLSLLLAAPAFAAPPAPAKALPRPAVPQSLMQVQMSFAPVVKRVAPAVVNVYARSVVQQQVNPLFDDPMFQRFFGVSPQMRQRVQQSLGSGVIVRPDGTILTNNHVVQGGQNIVVVLADKREFKAKVVLADARTDLAVLKIDAKGEKLPTLAFGDSDRLSVGDLVLAIGDPFGVGQTVTMGIVSALARTGVGASDYQFFIQTDAAVNPGNSGGALVTTDGKLAGINTAIVSRTGQYAGIGFAIPANLVKRVLESSSTGGTKLPWIGAKRPAGDAQHRIQHRPVAARRRAAEKHLWCGPGGQGGVEDRRRDFVRRRNTCGRHAVPQLSHRHAQGGRCREAACLFRRQAARCRGKAHTCPRRSAAPDNHHIRPQSDDRREDRKPLARDRR